MRRSSPTRYRHGPRFSPSKVFPVSGNHRSSLGVHARSARSPFWAGHASLVICFSAVRVISICQRLVGKLLLGETKTPLSSGSRRIPSMLNKFNSGQTGSQGATSFFRASTFLRSSPGLSMGVSAMKAAWAMRRSLRRMRKGSRPMVPFPMC